MIEVNLMRVVVVLLPASLCAGAAWIEAGPAFAADLPTAPSSYPALGPGPTDVAADYWSGLSVGAGISVWGGKGVKGGVGGETDLTYERVFDNGVLLGVQASTGYMPFSWSNPRFTQFTGGAFAGGSAIVGYNLGQVTPYIITGVDFARPTRFGGGAFNAQDAMNSVFSGPGAVQAVGTFGVGVNYRVTSNFSMGIEAIVHSNSGSVFGAWP
jgi:outer membrane immunogenic protein